MAITGPLNITSTSVTWCFLFSLSKTLVAVTSRGEGGGGAAFAGMTSDVAWAEAGVG